MDLSILVDTVFKRCIYKIMNSDNTHNICIYNNTDVHTRRIKENIPRTTRNRNISSVLLIVGNITWRYNTES